ncbi:MAG: alpha-D-glucose phosphate-specific phosphoglucomutase [Pantoea sp. Brub]|nr:alpha-D-glucose phosphate-specific phosphoglucomutase [Pantoea sp. Brub]
MISNHICTKQCDQKNNLINVDKLISQYYWAQPDAINSENMVKFGTSGHRGTSQSQSFNEIHLIAIAQAIIEQRIYHGITGPCYIGKDTHALSEPAILSILEVLTANHVNVIIQQNNGYTPTPSISHAILEYNKMHSSLADGIIITSSHNPPEYGGIKYNTPNGGPANIKITQSIENKANKIIKYNIKKIKRLSFNKALRNGLIIKKDLIQPYVEDLIKVINFSCIKQSSLKIGIDPLGSAGIEYWERIGEYYKLDITMLNNNIDKTFSFMHLDKDGLIRMDCSSKYCIINSLKYRNKFDLLFCNDPDNDRYGIILPTGLIKPNNYMIVAINYLFQHRLNWNKNIYVGKSLVSSSIINQVVQNIGRRIIELPVGFKWFVNGLSNSIFGFVGEESAGGSFLCFDGQPWSTDKDGILLCLLAAEITAKTGKTIQEHYHELYERFGPAHYNCLHKVTTFLKKNRLSNFSPQLININMLAGDPIISNLSIDSSNGINFNGFKIITQNGWCAVRPSGTECSYKIYSESFLNNNHRIQIERETIDIVDNIN